MITPELGPAATIAVVSFNTRALLDRCLRSMRADAEAGRCAVWVVDNGSSDGSAEMVSECYPWVSLHADGANRGFGAAVNLVAERTVTPWLVAANADVELTNGALATLLALGSTRADAAVVAPQLRLPDGLAQHSVYGFPTLPSTLALNLGLNRVSPALGDRLCLVGSWDPGRRRTVDWAVGAFLLLRRRAFDQVGGFDRHQWMYAEDLDLGWRLARAGWRTLYEPAAVVVHHQSAATERAWGEAKQERWMLSTYAWMLRRRGAPRTRVIAAINVIGALVRWGLFTLGRGLRTRPAEDAAWALRWARLHRSAGLGPRGGLERHR